MSLSVIEREEPDHYLFVIDTDAYAGNFERQMCAYVTGQVGICGVGKEYAELARKEIPSVVAKLEELIDSVPDEFGCFRPVTIFPTPGWFNHGMGSEFREGKEEEALVQYKQVIEKYYKLSQEDFAGHLMERVRNEIQQKIDEVNALTMVPKQPAYMSVAIYFHTLPDKDLIEVMKERARTIAAKGMGLKGFERPVGIEGFRFLEQYTLFRELKIIPK